MIYERIIEGKFISRPNRFIAHVEVDGDEVICHVKNTGRCRELLVPGAKVFLQDNLSPARKTRYDLIGVLKNGRMINMDSSAPNKVFKEYIDAGRIFSDVSLIRGEKVHGDSRFDFYVEQGEKKTFIEVKGVTLEQDGIVRFPDAPTERGVKHLRGLVRCVEEGYRAMAVFIVQMEQVRWFEPNDATHPQFGQALREAARAGVEIIAINCRVTENSVTALDKMEVRL
ncbi:MAG: DNA/RNA nuclease SfsA [Oscillospiraceae bacterium]|nr:DNA/RNA nuclease SfsA [Oscillospiraceae bacterium]